MPNGLSHFPVRVTFGPLVIRSHFSLTQDLFQNLFHSRCLAMEFRQKCAVTIRPVTRTETKPRKRGAKTCSRGKAQSYSYRRNLWSQEPRTPYASTFRVKLPLGLGLRIPVRGANTSLRMAQQF